MKANQYINILNNIAIYREKQLVPALRYLTHQKKQNPVFENLDSHMNTAISFLLADFLRYSSTGF